MANVNDGGAGGANDGRQWPQSQYFQSFETSHSTQPRVRRPCPIYTTEQKDTAIRLLNEGTSARQIAKEIGGSCSKNNPLHWRAEELERERRGQADRRALAAQRQALRQQWILAIRGVFVWIAQNFPPPMPAHPVLRRFLHVMEYIGLHFGLDLARNATLIDVYNLWAFILMVLWILLHPQVYYTVYWYSRRIAWLCVIYQLTIATILFPKPKP